MNIISFSGGADSTAVLVYCRENNVPYEEVIYSEDWFPYPGNYMKDYFNYIEKEFNIKITWLKCDRKKWMDSEGAGHGPWMPHPYCCRVKFKSKLISNIIDYIIPWGFLSREKWIHPSPKGTEIALKLMNKLKPENIIDPFLGSGSYAQAAVIYGIPWIGYEIEMKYSLDIDKRLKNCKKEPKQTSL